MIYLFSRRGSILVYTLLLLSIMLVAALSLATTTIIGKRGAIDTDKSMQAFQTADSGAEIILAKIKNAVNSEGHLSTLGTTCSEGKITGDLRGKYTISFFGTNPDGSEKVLGCGDKISDVTKIKSAGSFGETTRAIETAVAATGNIVSCSSVTMTGSSLGSFTANSADNSFTPVFTCCTDTGTCRVYGIPNSSGSTGTPGKWYDIADFN